MGRSWEGPKGSTLGTSYIARLVRPRAESEDALPSEHSAESGAEHAGREGRLIRESVNTGGDLPRVSGSTVAVSQMVHKLLFSR